MKHPIKAIPLAVAAMTVSAPASAALEPVTQTYVAIAQAGYEDSLISARTMRQAIATFLDAPSDATLAQARNAWIEARVPYQQTEVYRFGNAVVDEWEGKVNAWPLDEGLIDYVDAEAYGTESEENTFYAANIIANPTLTVARRSIDASTIDTELLQSLHEVDEVDEVEANVSTGYQRHRVPALGSGPQRYRSGGRAASGFRLHDGGGLHRRQLRPAAGVSDGRDRSPDCGSGRHRGRMGIGRRGDRGAGGAVGDGTGRGHADRHGKSLVRRAGR